MAAETAFSEMPWESGVRLCRGKDPRKCRSDLPMPAHHCLGIIGHDFIFAH